MDVSEPFGDDDDDAALGAGRPELTTGMLYPGLPTPNLSFHGAHARLSLERASLCALLCHLCVVPFANVMIESPAVFPTCQSPLMPRLHLLALLLLAAASSAFNVREHTSEHFHDIESDDEFEEYILDSNYVWAVLFNSNDYNASREEHELDGAIGIWEPQHGGGLLLQLARVKIEECPKTAKHYKVKAGQLLLFQYHGREATNIPFDDHFNTPWFLTCQHALTENLHRNTISHGHYRKVDKPKDEL